MENSQLDSFLSYIALIEEGSDQFSSDQVKKLELIRNKVSDIVKRCQSTPSPSSSSSVRSQPAGMLQSTPAGVMERVVSGFSEFVAKKTK